MRRIVIISILFSLLAVLIPWQTAAARADEGLSLSPLRQEAALHAGKTSSNSFTLADKTTKDIIVRLSLKSFTVTDRSYDYRFRDLAYDWVKLKNTEIHLRPGQKMAIPYDVVVPKDAASGGYYFAVLASTSMATGGGISTVQVAMPIYVTVDGVGLRRSGVVENASIPWLVTGKDLSYSYDVKNTGNVHIDGRFVVRLSDLFGNHVQTVEDHTVFPGTVRQTEGTLDAPLWPGVYQLIYGYTDTVSRTTISKTTYIVNLPPWSVAAVAVLVIAGGLLWSLVRRHFKPKER